ncbi:ABC transporter ATP-binding protein [candidate division KSB1 bacterium]|nr:ABC transporter ATP-binding protein [candidate division KSB1 bacterium]
MLYILLSNFLYTISPWILKNLIDDIEDGIEVRIIGYYALALVGISFLHLIFRYLVRYTIIVASRRIEYNIRNDYFLHLLKLPMKFYQTHRTGDLMARATNDLNAVRAVLGPGIMQGISNVIFLIFVIGMMFSLDVRLTLIVLIPFPFVTIISRLLIKYIFEISKKKQAKYSDLTAKTQENIAGARVVKAYVQEENEAEEFRELNEEYFDLNLRLTKIHATLMSTISFIMGSGILILIWAGGALVVNQTISIGDLVAFTVWIGMLMGPMISIGWIINIFQQGASSMERINEILNYEPFIKDDESTDHTICEIKGDIRLENLYFSYNKDSDYILRDINLHIPEGSTLGITGHTGCGKSTLMNIICRTIEPSSGRVMIDGNDIKKIPIKVLRDHIGYVPQETFLFSESISDNISFGARSADQSDIVKAANISTIHLDLQEFPEAYKTVVGERGITLSGGQKQRTALARAIIKNPTILILDDAFSSVDSDTENHILERIESMPDHQTRIIISQRISAIQEADNIIVLEDGQIREQGDHQQLLALNGYYANLHQKQLLEEALEHM